jgi:excisionase family DNA binding protein
VEPEDRLLKPAEVAAIFRVNPKTVAQWAEMGRLPYIRLPGGQRRYRESDVQAALARAAGNSTPSA